MKSSSVSRSVGSKRWRQWSRQGKVVDASEVHGWLKSWGTENEQDAPGSGK